MPSTVTLRSGEVIDVPDDASVEEIQSAVDRYFPLDQDVPQSAKLSGEEIDFAIAQMDRRVHGDPATRPIVSVPRVESQDHPLLAAGANVAGQAANFLLSPVGAATAVAAEGSMGVIPAIATRLGFALQGAHGLAKAPGEFETAALKLVNDFIADNVRSQLNVSDQPSSVPGNVQKLAEIALAQPMNAAMAVGGLGAAKMAAEGVAGRVAREPGTMVDPELAKTAPLTAESLAKATDELQGALEAGQPHKLTEDGSKPSPAPISPPASDTLVSASTGEGTHIEKAPPVAEQRAGDVSLGIHRPDVENPALRSMSDSEFDTEFRLAKSTVNAAEKVFDSVSDPSQLTPEQRQEIAAAQDSWGAARLERERRNYSDIHTEDVLRKMIDLADSGNDFPLFKVLANVLKERGNVKSSDAVGIYRMLPERILSDPDFKEATKGKFARFKEWLGKVQEEPNQVVKESLTTATPEEAAKSLRDRLESKTDPITHAEAESEGLGSYLEAKGWRFVKGRQEWKPPTAAQQFDDLIRQHGPEQGWVVNPERLAEGESKGARPESAVAAFGELKSSGARAANDIKAPGEQSFSSGNFTAAMKAELLPRLKEYLRKQKEPKVSGLTGAQKEMGLGREDFALAQETTGDGERIAAEKAKAAQDKLDAAKLAKEQQPELSGLKPSEGPGAASAGGSEFSLPTIEDLISGEKLAPKSEPRPAPATEPSQATTLQSLSTAARDAVSNVKGWIGGLAGQTFPRTTRLNRQLGELAARWVSSRIAARPKAEIFVADVLGDSGLSARDVGAALTEDNLRSIRDSFERAGKPEEAAAVQSIIGKKGSPFKTEADYQAFLADSRFKEVVERYKSLWSSAVEPQYKSAMGIDPEIELPSRGLQTGARINLRAMIEGEGNKGPIYTVSQGNLLGTLRRKSPFGVQATGAAEAYHADLNDLMENTFGRQDEIANKNAFEKALVESKNAVIAEPGQKVNIGGRPAVAFPLRRQTIIGKDGKGIGQNRMLYVNPKIATEYRIGSNVDFKPPAGLLSKINAVLNKSALAGITDASVHVMNLGSALFSLPSTSGRLLNDAFLSAFGRADIPVKLVRLLRKSAQDNRAQIAALSEIGAMREAFPPTRIPGMRQASKLIQWMDQTTRLLLDDAYKSMAQEGWVENTETSRREFVNQVGQYNARAQGYLTGKARQLGISPFVTAGKTFNTLGVRQAMLSPGVKASSVPAAIALRASMLSKWAGSASLVMAVNYLLTKDKGGGVGGRPGTPLGAIDTGEDDKQGRHVYYNVLGLTGQSRSMRVTGIKGFVEAERMGLDTTTAFDTAARDMVNSAISPWAGPVVRFGVGAASGYPTAINVGRAYPVVPPGTSQHLSDFKNAVIGSNPISGGIQKALEPGKEGWFEIIKSQFPRLVPQSGKSQDMIAHYPEIVKKAQANDFMDYVIHAARSIPMAERRKFVEAQISRLPSELREKARTDVSFRGVYKYK